MVCLRIAACTLASFALFAQQPSIEGRVQDSRGQAVADATVQLTTGSQTLTAKTGADGHYRFPALAPGTYTLRAESSAQGEASFGPFPLEPHDQKKVDLTLAGQPEFFDQPTFIVAGVTDSTNRGGHGSDAILRSSEALTKAAASLGKESSSTPTHPNEAEAHHVLAELDERDGKPLEAVREYQRAAELDPSERNLFDWAAELLAHRAHDPAIEVFTKGTRLFPHSTRMLLGLAVAYYAAGSYTKASERFFEAADLDPKDPSPYLFLGKVQSAAITESDGFLERMKRFAELHPENAWANYYHGACTHSEELLKKALRLDPTLAHAPLQLGTIYAARKDFPQAIAAFEKAIEIDPAFEEAHYRLAQAYVQTGKKEKAQQEFALHDRLAKESSQEVERRRREIQQFVIELRQPAASQHQ